MKSFFTKYYLRLQWFFNYSRNLWHLQSAEIINRLRENAVVPLNRFEHKIYSQHGEDGIIREIFNRIGTTSKTFFEFGAGSGSENNTIALLIDGWKGWWIDGGDYVDVYRNLFKTSIAEEKLAVAKKMVTSKNINDIVKDLHIPNEIDLISIDVDGNDYYIWEALKATSPRVVVIEYNAAYPPGVHFLQKESDAMWNGSNFFGSSLHTQNELAKKKGYTLVCCDLIGGNAFFVRNDLVGDKFEHAGDVSKIWQSPKYYLYYYGGHMPYINYGHVPAMGEWISHEKLS
jgi:hypothetical protein